MKVKIGGLFFLLLLCGCAALSTDSGLTLDGRRLTKREAHEGMKECARILDEIDFVEPKVGATKTGMGEKLKSLLERAGAQRLTMKDKYGETADSLFSLVNVATKEGRARTRAWIGKAVRSDTAALEQLKQIGSETDEFLRALKMPVVGSEMIYTGPEEMLSGFLDFLRKIESYVNLIEKLNPVVEKGKVYFRTQKDIDKYEEQQAALKEELLKLSEAIDNTAAIVEEARLTLHESFSDYDPSKGITA